MNINAIHNVGNFAAHPLKNTDKGLILHVEPVEAEWTLDKKLAEAGKPPMKYTKPLISKS
jgi:hypothetical protein